MGLGSAYPEGGVFGPMGWVTMDRGSPEAAPVGLSTTEAAPCTWSP